MEVFTKALLIAALALGGVGLGWGLKSMTQPATTVAGEPTDGQAPADQAQVGPNGQPLPNQPGYDRPGYDRPYRDYYGRPWYPRHTDYRYYHR